MLALRRAGRPLALTQLARQVLHVESGPVDAGCRSLEPRLAADDRLQRDGAGQWALTEWSRRGSPIDDVEFVVFDLETNGGHGGRHRILEVGAERVRGGVVLSRYDSLVRISGRVSRFVTRYTGITAGMLEGAPPIERVLDEFREIQDGAVLVAHNLPTDPGPSEPRGRLGVAAAVPRRRARHDGADRRPRPPGRGTGTLGRAGRARDRGVPKPPRPGGRPGDGQAPPRPARARAATRRHDAGGAQGAGRPGRARGANAAPRQGAGALGLAQSAARAGRVHVP